MKLRVGLFLAALILALGMVIQVPTGASVLSAAALIFLVGNLVSQGQWRLCATLSATEILQDTMDAFKSMLPMVTQFSTDFSSALARKDDQIMGHVHTLPTAQDYDATSGFKLNQSEADSLLTDVPVTLNQFKHVPVRVKYLTALASRKNLYRTAIANLSYVLAKNIVDYVLGLVTDANVTHESVVSTGNTTYDTLETVRTQLNTQRASPFGRFGIASSAFMGALAIDARIASRDYYGQLNGSSGYRRYTNVAGFENIWEYPDTPGNSINLTAFFGDPRAVVLASRVPDVNRDAESLGIPSIANIETVSDPDTGLTFLGIGWQDQGTLDVWLTMALLYGASVGAQGGGANAKTDRAAYKIVTA